MGRWFALAVQLVALVSSIYAKSSTGDSVLVVLEKDLPKERFSKFFHGLEGTCCSSLKPNTMKLRPVNRKGI